jgi:hypothetical protein
VIEDAEAGARIGCEINETNRLASHLPLRCAGVSNLVGKADFARTDEEYPPVKTWRWHACLGGPAATDAT